MLKISGGGKNNGVNLVLDSAQEISNSDYAIARYTLSEDFQLNQMYTCTIWGELGEDVSFFNIFLGGASFTMIPRISKISNGVYSASGYREDWNNSEPSNKKEIRIYKNINNQSNCTIHRIKIEKGINSNPVWTPNPADLVMRSELEDRLKGFVNVFFDKTVTGATYTIDTGLYLLFLSQGGGLNKYGMYFIRKTTTNSVCHIDKIAGVNFEVNFSEDYSSIVITSPSVSGDFNVSLFKVMDFT